MKKEREFYSYIYNNINYFEGLESERIKKIFFKFNPFSIEYIGLYLITGNFSIKNDFNAELITTIKSADLNILRSIFKLIFCVKFLFLKGEYGVKLQGSLYSMNKGTLNFLFKR